MSDEQKEATEEAVDETPEGTEPEEATSEPAPEAAPEKPAEEKPAEEKPAEPKPAAPKPAPKPAPVAASAPIQPRKPNPGGFVVSFVLGVVVGVLAYSTVQKTTTVDAVEQGGTVAVSGTTQVEPSAEALRDSLGHTAQAADDLLDLVRNKNFGKAARKAEELSTLFETAKNVAVSQEQRDLMDDLIVGAGTVQEAVNNVAEDSVERTEELRKQLEDAIASIQ